jgi:lipopolysaccharide export system protein LptA
LSVLTILPFHHAGIALRAGWITGLALALAAPSLAHAQQEQAPVVLDYYDELNRVVEGDSLTYFLTGNVRAHRGPVHMRSQRAVVYRKSQVADFQVNVHFWDQTTELYADHLVYYELTDVAVATGSVQVIDRESGSQLKAENVNYDRNMGLLVAHPRPELVLVPRDTAAAAEPFRVWGDVMRFTSDSTRTELVAIDNVLIERSDLTAISDSLHYDDEIGRVALRVEPRIETAETYLTAEWIDIELDQSQRLEALIAVKGARAIDKRDSVPDAVPAAFDNVSPTSFLEGDSLYIDFEAEAVQWILAEGNARSLHYARESPPGPVESWSVNYLLGQRLRLNFRGDTLVQVVASGGHRGIYRSETVNVAGPRQVPSEPIPLPEEPRAAAAATRPRRARR